MHLSIIMTSYLDLEVQYLVPLWVCILLNDLSTQLERESSRISISSITQQMSHQLEL